jgi:hypothetical protein
MNGLSMADESGASGERQRAPAGRSAAALREERLAQALRANLKRRKDQARSRADTARPAEPESDVPPADNRT